MSTHTSAHECQAGCQLDTDTHAFVLPWLHHPSAAITAPHTAIARTMDFPSPPRAVPVAFPRSPPTHVSDTTVTATDTSRAELDVGPVAHDPPASAADVSAGIVTTHVPSPRASPALCPAPGPAAPPFLGVRRFARPACDAASAAAMASVGRNERKAQELMAAVRATSRRHHHVHGRTVEGGGSSRVAPRLRTG